MKKTNFKLMMVCIVAGCLVAAGLAFAYPHFRLITPGGWEDANDGGGISEVNETEWSDYLGQFNDPNNLEGTPYPSTQFRSPTLYVYGGEGTDYNDVGVVMAWGDGNKGVVGQNYASAWQYVYREDPDLSNSIITVTVEPPCPANITTISLGLRDNNGRICSWTWNVAAAPGPGTIQCSPSPGAILTTITIDLSQMGINAASPAPSSYSINNSPPTPFDLTIVTAIIFDENSNWVAIMPVPPGGSSPNAWNYWTNLSVSPKPPSLDQGNFIKWRQPPRWYPGEPNLIWGWDEYSDYNDPCIMADDWRCKTNRPVTDVHWWGSYIGWIQLHPPPIQPKAFHLGIWTDSPDPDPCDPNNFSHPDKLVWENYCDNYVWSFVADDKDPFNRPERVNETCFKFAQLLSQDEWFYQDPDPCDPNGSIYWLSIAAVYDSNDYRDPNLYPWGWKTRPHHFNDDAASITALSDSSWPPTVGKQWSNGAPLKGPGGVTWDLAFELTTNQGLLGNSNFDFIVDWGDFRVFADRWLMTIP